MDDDAEPVFVVDDETKPDEVKVDAVAADAKTDEGSEPKPGTPDKALQKLQQELGNVTRQLAALNEKKESGERLSESDKAKLAKAQERIDAIRQQAGDPVSEQVLELTERVGTQDALKAELEDTKARLRNLENTQNWNIARNKYTGLDVDAIWTKAQADANHILGEAATPAAVSRVASNYFEERCEAAMKRAGEKPNKDKVPASTPSTYKVGTAQVAAPVLSEDDETLAMARMLVHEE